MHHIPEPVDLPMIIPPSYNQSGMEGACRGRRHGGGRAQWRVPDRGQAGGMEDAGRGHGGCMEGADREHRGCRAQRRVTGRAQGSMKA